MSVRLPQVLVIGGGELGSAVAHKLVRGGMKAFIADLDRPTCIRTSVCFAMALWDGAKEVEDVTAVRVASMGEDSAKEASVIAAQGKLPVLVVDKDFGGWKKLAAALGADVVIDARMLKRNQGISKDLAPLVVGLGPGFSAGRDVHVVIETNRGPNLGSLIYDGQAEADTGVPAEVAGYSGERVIRAPRTGVFTSQARIGEMVMRGEVVGSIDVRIEEGADGEASTKVEVVAPIGGLMRGLVMDGVRVEKGQKIGDVDPRGRKINPLTISDKGRAVAGGVLEAIMHWWARSNVRS